MAAPVALKDVVDDVAHAPVLSLFEALSKVPDPRVASGRRHSMAALLALLVVAFCTGAETVKDAVLFGRARKWLRKELGFTHDKCPSQSTYTRLFKVLPMEDVRAALSQWLLTLARLRSERRGQGLCAAVDGKALRGAGVHTLNIFVHDLWTLLDQYEVDVKANEMSAFRGRMDEFLGRYPFVKLLTFDAIFCEQKTMETLTRHNRMGIFQVKENQPEGLFRIERLFSAHLGGSPDTESVEKKRGLHRDPKAVGSPAHACNP